MPPRTRHTDLQLWAAHPMLQQLRQSVAPLLILAGGVAGYFWLSGWNEPPTRIPAPSQPPLVETETVKRHSGEFSIRVNGVVVPFREIQIKAEVDGRIVRKAEELRSGRFISAGTPLMSIDAEPYELELEKVRLEAQDVDIEQQSLSVEARQLETLISLAKKRLELATRDFNRFEKLKANDASSEAERDLAERSVLQSQDALELLKNRRELFPLRESRLRAKRDLISTRQKAVELDLSRTQIPAPVDGVITADLQEAGSFVERGDHLLTLQDTSQFEVTCRLRSEDLYWLYDASGMNDVETPKLKAAFEIPEVEAEVTFRAAGESFNWSGRLVRSDGTGFDPTTRTLACRVVIEKPVRSAGVGLPTLVAGMFVDVVVKITPRTRLLAVPRDALQPDGQVWLINDGKLAVRRVRPARVTDSVVLLREDRTDIQSGSRVVVSTLPIAFDGMDVRERPVP